MEGGLVQHRRQIVGHVNNNGRVIKKKNLRRRSFILSSSTTTTRKSKSCVKDVNMKREVRVSSGLQKLYYCCKGVFKGPGLVPLTHDVHSLCNILDSMRPEDLGLSRELQFFKPESGVSEIPRVTCTTVYECPKKKFSLVLFFLPASAVIPLHNHPEMTVFSKLLLGTMHIKAYDWADSADIEHEYCQQSSSLRLARLKANSVFTAPCNTSVLYPTSGGNIHAFTAITPCVVLDVIGPPYSKRDGRDCTYYTDIVYKSPDGKLDEENGSEQSYAWLKEIDVPEHSKMNCIQYLGPQVVD
ncbi:hypothetical protein RND81_10G058000 [Saponaria officinalis]|uniref:cysteine dioxygenase n=1 Tax=Saponaria officinalis TaxID=3572 RepID=A0AAW1I108_SAPOF